jgi:hypothetical protein
MRRRVGSVLTAMALLITLWLIWQKLYIVVHVNMPWWGFLILGALLFLAVDYILSKIFDRG